MLLASAKVPVAVRREARLVFASVNVPCHEILHVFVAPCCAAHHRREHVRDLPRLVKDADEACRPAVSNEGLDGARQG